ncbi:MAG: SDR family NAD(P)-dependent oxidoreductase [Candidatus Marinamargulisbacteria bacterium]
MTHTKVAIITGASSGLGADMARHYAKEGYYLGLLARREKTLMSLQQTLQNAHGVMVRIAPVDVGDKPRVFSAIHDIITHFGRVDLLIANAGISLASPAHQPQADALEATIQTNVLGAGYSAYAVIPQMMHQQSGQIVAISSLAGYRGLPEAGTYCASKAAVNALFESMRLDLKRHGISVSIIRPGYIQSPLTDRNDFYMPGLLTTQKGVQKIVRAIHKKRAIHAFPWPLALVVKSLYFWPCWLYDACLAGVRNKKRAVPK